MDCQYLSHAADPFAAANIGVLLVGLCKSHNSFFDPFHGHFAKRTVVVLTLDVRQLRQQFGIDAESSQRLDEATQIAPAA
jgi:hypothetical protein